jgi:hypothetical protein
MHVNTTGRRGLAVDSRYRNMLLQTHSPPASVRPMVAYVSEVSEESSLLSSLVSQSLDRNITSHRKQRRPFDFSALHLGRSRAKLYLQHRISKKNTNTRTRSPLTARFFSRETELIPSDCATSRRTLFSASRFPSPPGVSKSHLSHTGDSIAHLTNRSSRYGNLTSRPQCAMARSSRPRFLCPSRLTSSFSSLTTPS